MIIMIIIIIIIIFAIIIVDRSITQQMECKINIQRFNDIENRLSQLIDIYVKTVFRLFFWQGDSMKCILEYH